MTLSVGTIAIMKVAMEEQMGGDVDTPPGPWELHNNWRRWLGWDLRRRVYDNVYHNGGWWWEYARSSTVAHDMLHSAYAPKEPFVGEIRLNTATHGPIEMFNGTEWRKVR